MRTAIIHHSALLVTYDAVSCSGFATLKPELPTSERCRLFTKTLIRFSTLADYRLLSYC